MNIPGLSRAQWRTSSHSSGNGACVEIASTRTVIAVRDSKDRSGPILAFSHAEWREFTARITSGDYSKY